MWRLKNTIYFVTQVLAMVYNIINMCMIRFTIAITNIHILGDEQSTLGLDVLSK